MSKIQSITVSGVLNAMFILANKKIKKINFQLAIESLKENFHFLRINKMSVYKRTI